MWNPKFEQYGVIQVEDKRVRIHKDQYNSETIYVGESVSHALWNGGMLTVYLNDGTVRRYSNIYNYTTIR